MKINVKICNRLQFLRDCPCQTFHLCTVRISRKFSIKVLIVYQSHTSITLFKCRSVCDLYNNDRTGDFLNLQFLGQFNRSLNSYIFSRMYTCCDQHGLSCAMPMKYCHRKFKFSIGQFQFSVPFFSWFCRNIFQLKGLSFSSAQKKDRRGTVINDFFFCPYFFPYVFITGNIQKSCLSHRFQIPFRAFQTTQRNLTRDFFHLFNIRTAVIIFYILLFCLLTVFLVTNALLFII